MKIPTPAELAKGQMSQFNRDRVFAAGARAMASAIRDALREEADRIADFHNVVPWALRSIADEIDQALGTSETQTEKGRA